MDDNRRNGLSPKSSPISCQSKEVSISNPSKENRKNSISVNSIGDIGLNEMLDSLIKPDVRYPSDVAGKVMEDYLVFLLKSVPISDFKHMVTLANGIFMYLNSLHIDYSSFYERVKNYIRCSALLVSSLDFKQGSSAEKVAAEFDKRKLHHAMVCETFEEIFTYRCEQNILMQDMISAKVKKLKQLETEGFVPEENRASRKLEETSKKIKKSEVELKYLLEKGKKKCQTEVEVLEAFMIAKAALNF